MAVYATIQELKNAIHDTIYENNAGLVTADILQDRLIDIVDTILGTGIVEYELPIASASVLGGIMIGPALSIDQNGVLTVVLGDDVLKWDPVNSKYTPHPEIPQTNNNIKIYGALYNWYAAMGIVD